MIAHGPENVFYCGWGNLHRGGAVPPGADLYGLASHDRRLVGTDVGELDRPRRRWQEACGQAKIKLAISFHVLRHTYGSTLAMRVIAEQLGHADTRMTEKHYAHLAPSYVADTTDDLRMPEDVCIAPLFVRKRV